MSKFFKKLFGTLSDKPWEKEQMEADNYHQGKTFDISLQTSSVIVIFGASTVLFTLLVTGYLYSIPASQDTGYLLKPNLLWLNTLILLFVTYFFNKITKNLKNNKFEKIKSNLLIVGFLSYAFLFGQIFFWFQLMESGKFVSTNSYFTSFYFWSSIELDLSCDLIFIYFWSSLKLSIACEALATPDKLERTRLFDLITRPINKYKSS